MTVAVPDCVLGSKMRRHVDDAIAVGLEFEEVASVLGSKEVVLAHNLTCSKAVFGLCE